MISLQFQYEHLSGFLSEEEILLMQEEIDISHSLLVEKAGKGNQFLGWIDLPVKTDETLIISLEADAASIRKNAEILVVVGIGGSYLGARAIIEALSSPFSSFYTDNNNPVVIYAGQNISQDYHAELLQLLDKKEYAIVVISKSGTTTEPAIAFRLLKNHIEKKYGPEEAARRIIVITDGSKGALKSLSEKHGYKTYVIPGDVGGRYSVLTPVGLLPIAIAGFDIRQLLHGANEMRKVCTETSSLIDNPAASYAAIRTLLYRLGNQIEILVNYEPAMHYVTEWWKQLFGESEGKENEGLFPAGVDFTSDLHSMGQYIQQGQRLLFETVIHIRKSKKLLTVPVDESNLDGINYIARKTLQQVNDMAALATTLAHSDGEVPNLDIFLPVIDECALGELIYFFEFACGLSGYLLGINPFNQPGVEAYKNNMFALLGKPGFENETEAIRARIHEE
ncbi:MAG: glucose-6-phosphate isomerase [Lentimicrobiaceae bacterium]|jgi:glucose-6-phosphate isomerase